MRAGSQVIVSLGSLLFVLYLVTAASADYQYEAPVRVPVATKPKTVRTHSTETDEETGDDDSETTTTTPPGTGRGISSPVKTRLRKGVRNTLTGGGPSCPDSPRLLTEDDQPLKPRYVRGGRRQLTLLRLEWLCLHLASVSPKTNQQGRHRVASALVFAGVLSRDGIRHRAGLRSAVCGAAMSSAPVIQGGTCTASVGRRLASY